MRIYSYAQFKELVGGFPRCGRYIYRGIGGQFKLLPSISYNEETDVEILRQRAAQAQREFNDNFHQFCPNRHLTDYQLIFLARHCGLISPFMDFSLNDTIAIQFGMEMANANPVHLYVMDINGEPIYNNVNGGPENNEFRIYRPYIVWHPNGFLTQERTQLIQNARLVTQNAETIAIPFDLTFPERITCYEIFPEDFERIKQEIIDQDGIRMDTNLLIDNSSLFQIAKAINTKMQSKVTC